MFSDFNCHDAYTHPNEKGRREENASRRPKTADRLTLERLSRIKIELGRDDAEFRIAPSRIYRQLQL